MHKPVITAIKNLCIGLFLGLLSNTALCDEKVIAKAVTTELATCTAYFLQQANMLENAGSNISEQMKQLVVRHNKSLASKTFEQAIAASSKEAAETAVSGALKEMQRLEKSRFGASLLTDKHSEVCAAIASNPQYWINITKYGTSFVCETENNAADYEQKLNIAVRLPNKSVLNEAEFSLAAVNPTWREPVYLSDTLRTALGTFSARIGNLSPRVQLFVVLDLSTQDIAVEKYTAVHGLLIRKESNMVSTLTIEHEHGGFTFKLYDPALDHGQPLSGSCTPTSTAALQ